MVTNIKEGKTKKCEQYWPEAGSGMSCGPFNLSLEEQHIFADYTVRTIQLVVSVQNSFRALRDGGQKLIPVLRRKIFGISIMCVVNILYVN